MRCPKCGTIDFDYLTTCLYCKTDLTKIKEKLGNFMQPPAEPVKWLNEHQPTVSPAAYLQELDVSDLVRDDYGVGEPVSIELEPLDIDIKDISSSEELKKKLDQLDGLLDK